MWTLVMSAVALTVAAVLGLVVTRRRLVVIDVIGPSMQPTFRPGDRVLMRRRAGGQVRRGSVVVLRSGRQWMIKRVVAVPGDPVPDSVRPAVRHAGRVPSGRLVVLGDGERSADSRLWGFVPVDAVLGSVVRSMPSRGRSVRG